MLDHTCTNSLRASVRVANIFSIILFGLVCQSVQVSLSLFMQNSSKCDTTRGLLKRFVACTLHGILSLHSFVLRGAYLFCYYRKFIYTLQIIFCCYSNVIRTVFVLLLFFNNINGMSCDILIYLLVYIILNNVFMMLNSDCSLRNSVTTDLFLKLSATLNDKYGAINCSLQLLDCIMQGLYLELQCMDDCECTVLILEGCTVMLLYTSCFIVRVYVLHLYGILITSFHHSNVYILSRFSHSFGTNSGFH